MCIGLIYEFLLLKSVFVGECLIGYSVFSDLLFLVYVLFVLCSDCCLVFFLTVDAFGAIYKQFFLTADIAVRDERVKMFVGGDLC